MLNKLQEMIENMGFSTIIENNIIILKEKKIAFGVIDFNNSYEKLISIGKTSREAVFFHQEKIEHFNNKNIQLIYINQDDIIYNKEAVFNLLKGKLGLIKKIGARKTIFSLITNEEAKCFLDIYHIQGFKQGTYYCALKYSNKIVAVMVITKIKEDFFSIERYASSYYVQGGFTKILEAFKKIETVYYIESFADMAVSNGNLYEHCGFLKKKIYYPDYKYIFNNRLVHKFNFRIHRFKNDTSLIFEDGKTEKELALLNNIERIFTCEKIKYIYYKTGNGKTGIYKITNKINKKCYIGQSIDIEKRWQREKTGNCNKFLKDDFVKYGIDNFDFEILEECKFEDLNKREKFYIQKFNSKETGYNLTSGGEYSHFGQVLDEKVKRLISIRTKEALANEDTKRKMSDSHKGEKNANYGKNQFENETKENREKRLRKCKAGSLLYWANVSNEEKEIRNKKISEKVSGEKNGMYGKNGSLNPAAVAVRNIETNEIFNTIKEACEKYKLKSSAGISMCCSGKQETAGNFHWEYVN
ncbi:MAG: GIY-YIG nuclease family protein [Elusimicrobiota bacterium]|jgi:group I intron endonuclease|nr:GIY-YIG nuclease family protein [Elusimicrobiota bacterium]